MRYTVLRYIQTSKDSLAGYIDPIGTTIYSSFEAAEERLQYLYAIGQSLHSKSINTSDKSAHVWKSTKQIKHGSDFVIVTREDNPFFAVACLVNAFTWYHTPASNYWEPLFDVVRDYLTRTTDQPALFKS